VFNDGSIDETLVQGVQDWMCSGGLLCISLSFSRKFNCNWTVGVTL
jgi:hypothetical protein